jgi:hypothetical protein
MTVARDVMDLNQLDNILERGCPPDEAQDICVSQGSEAHGNTGQGHPASQQTRQPSTQ